MRDLAQAISNGEIKFSERKRNRPATIGREPVLFTKM